MDYSQLAKVIERNVPFKIETAAGRVFEIPHRDFISFSPKRTTAIVSYTEDGEDVHALVPLLTVTSIIAPGLTERELAS